ncbi:transposase [Streptomyces sp. NBC_01483]|uniref:transposase n=1 Tax=Streptomyces sp. NBC_01483 TaxID=2903883 RepID=UPI002E359E66|nr:transposase [Streptomyces sp. NBC_01483]
MHPRHATAARGGGAGHRRDPARSAALGAGSHHRQVASRPGPVAHRLRRRARQRRAIEGRTAADVLAWLVTTPLQWRKSIKYVAIDMSATYRAAVRTGLPHATVVVDHFHVVQLANKMLSKVRRRTTAEIRGRRGRASDPEWKAGRRLLRNREDLTDEHFATMWNTLRGEGDNRANPPDGMDRQGEPA